MRDVPCEYPFGRDGWDNGSELLDGVLLVLMLLVLGILVLLLASDGANTWIGWMALAVVLCVFVRH